MRDTTRAHLPFSLEYDTSRVQATEKPEEVRNATTSLNLVVFDHPVYVHFTPDSRLQQGK